MTNISAAWIDATLLHSLSTGSTLVGIMMIAIAIDWIIRVFDRRLGVSKTLVNILHTAAELIVLFELVALIVNVGAAVMAQIA